LTFGLFKTPLSILEIIKGNMSCESGKKCQVYKHLEEAHIKGLFKGVLVT